MAGRNHAIPDDVKALAEVTLAHRIIVRPDARINNVTSRAVINDILNATPVAGTSPWQ
jgi:MoxR-like ATPase